MYVNHHPDSGATVQYVPAARGGNTALLPPSGINQQSVGNKLMAEGVTGNPDVLPSSQQVIFYTLKSHNHKLEKNNFTGKIAIFYAV